MMKDVQNYTKKIFIEFPVLAFCLSIMALTPQLIEY